MTGCYITLKWLPSPTQQLHKVPSLTHTIYKSSLIVLSPFIQSLVRDLIRNLDQAKCRHIYVVGWRHQGHCHCPHCLTLTLQEVDTLSPASLSRHTNWVVEIPLAFHVEPFRLYLEWHGDRTQFGRVTFEETLVRWFGVPSREEAHRDRNMLAREDTPKQVPYDVGVFILAGTVVGVKVHVCLSHAILLKVRV